MKRIWEESEPNGLVLRPAEQVAWLPKSQGKNDIPIMELVTKHYTPEQAKMINRYRLYLQVSIYDLLLRNTGVQKAYNI